jgi:hypothetical protein
MVASGTSFCSRGRPLFSELNLFVYSADKYQSLLPRVVVRGAPRLDEGKNSGAVGLNLVAVADLETPCSVETGFRLAFSFSLTNSSIVLPPRPLSSSDDDKFPLDLGELPESDLAPFVFTIVPSCISFVLCYHTLSASLSSLISICCSSRCRFWLAMRLLCHASVSPGKSLESIRSRFMLARLTFLRTWFCISKVLQSRTREENYFQKSSSTPVLYLDCFRHFSSHGSCCSVKLVRLGRVVLGPFRFQSSWECQRYDPGYCAGRQPRVSLATMEYMTINQTRIS